MQFSKDEDFGRYPRQREADIAKLTAAGVEAIFEPESLYAAGAVLCGTTPQPLHPDPARLWRQV